MNDSRASAARPISEVSESGCMRVILPTDTFCSSLSEPPTRLLLRYLHLVCTDRMVNTLTTLFLYGRYGMSGALRPPRKSKGMVCPLSGAR